MNILLIQGGWSPERDVSLAGCAAIRAALERLGHTVTLFDPVDGLDLLPAIAQQADFAFIGLHGAPGEDGLVQAMLEQLGVAYQGSCASSSLLALDKHAAKAMFRAHNLPVAPSVHLSSKPAQDWRLPLSLPVFIKSTTGGSSLQMEHVTSPEALPACLERLFQFGGSYLVEQAVSGLEITCGVLGTLDEAGHEHPVALPPVLIKAANPHGIFDYASKYSLENGAEEICPAPIDTALTRQIQDIAIAAHKILGLAGYSRSDLIVSPTGPILLETNTLPGMTSTSLLPQEAAAIGLSFDDLIARLLALGLARAQRQKACAL